MAEELADFKFTEKRGNASVYPWDEWLNGKLWTLQAGVDFTVDASKFQNNANSAARGRGKRCKTQKLDGGKYVVIQAFEITENGK